MQHWMTGPASESWSTHSDLVICYSLCCVFHSHKYIKGHTTDAKLLYRSKCHKKLSMSYYKLGKKESKTENKHKIAVCNVEVICFQTSRNYDARTPQRFKNSHMCNIKDNSSNTVNVFMLLVEFYSLLKCLLQDFGLEWNQNQGECLLCLYQF